MRTALPSSLTPSRWQWCGSSCHRLPTLCKPTCRGLRREGVGFVSPPLPLLPITVFMAWRASEGKSGTPLSHLFWWTESLSCQRRWSCTSSFSTAPHCFELESRFLLRCSAQWRRRWELPVPKHMGKKPRALRCPFLRSSKNCIQAQPHSWSWARRTRWPSLTNWSWSQPSRNTLKLFCRQLGFQIGDSLVNFPLILLGWDGIHLEARWIKGLDNG